VEIEVARYNLIMSDENYMKLMKVAVERGITMGRLLNDLIQKAVDGQVIDFMSACIVCGDPAKYRAFEDGKMWNLCETHFKEKKDTLEGWKEL
jgi:hypothetical protein